MFISFLNFKSFFKISKYQSNKNYLEPIFKILNSKFIILFIILFFVSVKNKKKGEEKSHKIIYALYFYLPIFMSKQLYKGIKEREKE